MVTYKELICLMTAMVVGFIIGAVLVTAIVVFSEKSKDE